MEQSAGVNMATQFEKERHRAERQAHRAKKLSGYVAPTVTAPAGPVDCACVIHVNGYTAC